MNGYFFMKPAVERTQHLVHDQRRVEDDLALLLGAVDQLLLAIRALVVEDFLVSECGAVVRCNQ